VRRLDIFWHWEVLVVVLAESMLALALVGDMTSLRRVVVLVFVGLCPGLCLIRLLGLRFELPVDIAYSVTASLVIVGILAGITLYAGRWSPDDVANSLAAALIIIAPASAFARNERSHDPHRHTRP
jgi:uncharacterized membrane protein